MILVVLIWGTNFSMAKIALAQIPPTAFAAIRFIIASVMLWSLLRVREGAIPLPRGNIWKLIWIGVLGSGMYQIFYTFGLRITTAANAALIIATVPALVALFGALLGIERMTINIGIGVVLAFVGVVLVLLARGLSLSFDTIIGDLLILAAAACWTAYTLGVRTLTKDLSPLRITTLTMIVGAPMLLVASVPDLISMDWRGISLAAWGGLVYAAVLATVVAYVLWNNSVRAVGGSRTAVYGTIIPLVAALVAWPMLGEQPTILQGFGAVLIIAGVLMTRRT